MYMSMDANVSADLTVERAGEPIGSLSCRGRVTRVAWTASASEYRAVFQAAMTEFANDCGPRLVRLLRGDPSR
jgi:hypothetical protein